MVGVSRSCGGYKASASNSFCNWLNKKKKKKKNKSLTIMEY